MANLISYFTKNAILSAREGLEIYDFTGESVATRMVSCKIGDCS